MIEALVEQDFKNALKMHEDAYAFAYLVGQQCNYLGFAVATESGLCSTVNSYKNLGYRYKGDKSFSDDEAISMMLRWANPDDGWHHYDFTDHQTVESYLASFSFNEELLMSSLCKSNARVKKTFPNILIGATYGQDPDDFRLSLEASYTATELIQFKGQYSQMLLVGEQIERI